MQNFCFTDVGQTLKSLGTSREGLSSEEAAKRLKTYGENALERGKKTGIIKLFLSQFKDVMTILLIAAAAVSAVIAFISKDTNDLTDTFIILAIILLNSVVGTVQQFRADKAIEKLKKLSACKVKVRRGGIETTLDSNELTVGDIVLLEEGDVIPADCRIIECNNLKCDESALTGESVGVEKDVAPIKEGKIALGAMKNSLFNSTYVVRGNASAVVTAVGMDTEMGKIAKMLQNTKAAGTPLEKTLNKLGKIISGLVLAVTAVIFILGLCVRSDGLLKNFMTSVAIAVAAIPEGLPAVVTIIMAMGVQKMSKKKVVIRKLKSVETLGGCSVICSDKTGTLTQNKMRVVTVRGSFTDLAIAENTGVKRRILQCMTACSGVKGEKGNYLGDPTEIALKEYADGCNYFENFEKLAEIPFSSERKMMTVAAAFGGERLSFTKGAPDILINKCTRILTESGTRPLTDADRRSILAENDGMSDEALRVLGFAYRDFGGKAKEEELVFIGLCGMTDGLKEGVKEAVAECKAAGVATVMITGDHVRTAFSIAKKLGIANDMSEVVSGEELDGMNPRERNEAIARCRVFARVSPKHKNMIVKVLQKKGQVTAMTGDGINDAPALKTADIGIAMGRTGTDVTKNVSDMVIADDNFTTIVAAVREGRRISANIRKTIQFFLSTNLAEVLAILIASLVFFRNDFMLSTQLLWLNLITDSFPVLALGMEREDADIMKRAPVKAEKSLFSKTSVASIAFYGLFMTAVTIGVYAVALKLCGNEVATAMTFLTISFLELFQAFNIRSERQSLFKCGIFTNKILLITVAAGIIVNVLLAVSPLASAFGLCALNWKHWLIVLALSLSVIPIGELYKLFLRIYSRKHKDSPARSIVLPKPLRKMLRLFKKCVNIFGKAASAIKKPFARKRNVPDADGV
ncbi:MAG: calcium-translocating P-type ATPase, PMCA-type [Clostridia bacterium]|nr:calcium-translocating P-type ATPase, PMCA-type [Clostridia bacterium]